MNRSVTLTPKRTLSSAAEATHQPGVQIASHTIAVANLLVICRLRWDEILFRFPFRLLEFRHRRFRQEDAVDRERVLEVQVGPEKRGRTDGRRAVETVRKINR